MTLSRRTLLAGSAALFTALPPSLGRGVHAPAAPTVVVGRPAWWGWSWDEEIWHGVFDSREAALADALDNGVEGDGFSTALCTYRELGHPDYAETIVEWLCGATREPDLSRVLASDFMGGNEERDFEGEVAEAVDGADWPRLATVFLPLVEAAIERAGLFVAGPLRHALVDDTAALVARLGDDRVLAEALARAAEAWSDANGLLESSIMVDLHAERSHRAPDSPDAPT
jgi:hypothetical protein